MKKVYQCTNNFELQPFVEVLKRHDIKHLIKNEYISSVIGEVPFTEAWPEIWVIDNHLEAKARDLCKSIELELMLEQPDWTCRNCGELNHANFEFCWQCEQLNHTAL